MKEERILKLDVEDIIKILVEHFDENKSDEIKKGNYDIEMSNLFKILF